MVKEWCYIQSGKNTLGAIERVKFHHVDFVGIMFPCDHFVVGEIKQTNKQTNKRCQMLQAIFPGFFPTKNSATSLGWCHDIS